MKRAGDELIGREDCRRGGGAGQRPSRIFRRGGLRDRWRAIPPLYTDADDRLNVFRRLPAHVGTVASLDLGSGSVSSRSLTSFEMTDQLVRCHSERKRGIFLDLKIRSAL